MEERSLWGQPLCRVVTSGKQWWWGMLCGTRKGGDYVEEPGRMALGRLLTAGRERGHFYLHFLSLRWFLSLSAAFLTPEH